MVLQQEDDGLCCPMSGALLSHVWCFTVPCLVLYSPVSDAYTRCWAATWDSDAACAALVGNIVVKRVAEGGRADRGTIRLLVSCYADAMRCPALG